MKTEYDYSKIDFEKDVTRDNIDENIYKAKFKFVDSVMALENPNPKYWRTINEDLSMKAYSFMRLDGSPLKPYPYQDLIMNDKHRFKYFRAANQVGKSLYLDVDALGNFITDHGHSFNSAIVSKSLPQSIHQMRRIKGLLNSMEHLDWKEDKGSSDSMSVISIDFKTDKGKIKYSNLIICAPCTEGLLGYDLHKLYLDEFEFWETDTEHFFNQIAQPRTYTTKGDIIITTNPNGADSFGAELEKQRTRGKRKWHVYVFNYLDKPGNTVEEYEDLKAELPRASFESTVAAIRTLSDKNYFTPDEIERSEAKALNELSMVGKQPFFFLDVGAKRDHSVLTAGYVEPDSTNEEINRLYIPIIHQYPQGYPISRVVGSYDKKQDSDGWHVEKSVKDYLEEWSAGGIVPVFGVDATGNTGIIPLMDATQIVAEDIQFSGPAKSGMYVRFKYFMEKGLIHRKKSKVFDYEARHLQVKKSVRGYLMIHHESETDHDDVMDSVAGLIHLADPTHIPAGVVII